MSFVVRMALREIRASWHRLLFFFICIAIGVMAIVVIRSVIQSVRNGLTREARTLTGARLRDYQRPRVHGQRADRQSSASVKRGGSRPWSTRSSWRRWFGRRTASRASRWWK